MEIDTNLFFLIHLFKNIYCGNSVLTVFNAYTTDFIVSDVKCSNLLIAKSKLVEIIFISVVFKIIGFSCESDGGEDDNDNEGC